MKCTLTPYLTSTFARRMAAGDPVKDREHLQRRKLHKPMKIILQIDGGIGKSIMAIAVCRVI